MDTKPTPPNETSGSLRMVVIAVGDAAGKALAGMDELPADAHCLMVNSEFKSSPARGKGIKRITLGSRDGRNAALGGEPEHAREAAECAERELRKQFQSDDLVILLAGLGRATGSGATPVIARMAKESGARVISVLSLPFDFEGSLRRKTADAALRQLKANSDGVICLPNQTLARSDDARALGPGHLFEPSDRVFGQVVSALGRMLLADNFIEISVSDLCCVFGHGRSECHFAAAEAEGEQAPQEALERLLQQPMLESGEALAAASAVLVYLLGDAGINRLQIDAVMERVNQICGDVNVILGAGQGMDSTGRLRLVILFARHSGEVPSPQLQAGQAAQLPTPGHPFMAHLEPDGPARARNPFSPPPPQLTPEQKNQVLEEQKAKGRALQFDLPLETVSRGRFENSERTIHAGEDLDVPTFIRRGVRV